MNQADLNILFIFYSWNEKSFPADSMRMMFVSNHDKNAWEGTEFEQFGDGLETAMVLSVVGEGMPLIYNGQEAGNFKRLEFFQRDPIEWKAHPNGEVYKKLFALKKANTTLWNAKWGARMIHVPNSAPTEVFRFVRQNERDKVFAVLNFSAKPHLVTFQEHLFHGRYTDYFSEEAIELGASAQVDLAPWGYRVFIQ